MVNARICAGSGLPNTCVQGVTPSCQGCHSSVDVMSGLYSQTEDMINVYKILVVKRGGKRPFGRPRLDVKIILKNDIG